jgi:hypothetical protein
MIKKHIAAMQTTIEEEKRGRRRRKSYTPPCQSKSFEIVPNARI